MIAPPLSPEEPLRLEALRRLHVVDTPIEERFERITRLARQLLRVKIAAISMVEADRQWFKSIQGADSTQTSRDISFCGHTVLQNDIFVIENALEDPRFFDNPMVVGKPFVRAYAGCPIRAEDGSNVGALCVKDDQPRRFSADDLATLRDLAGLVETEMRAAVAKAVEAELIEGISAQERRALIDSLTRLWNREGILRVADEALRGLRESAREMALILIDIDKFKEINDGYGHAAGDEVLRVCARRMLGAVRETDSVGRLGGDEFLLVISGGKVAKAAAEVAERVQMRINEAPVMCGQSAVAVTASSGWFVPRDAGLSIAKQLELADQALYESKEGGRNRTTQRLE